ncbi:PTS N-acetylgalactosamine transporter subunit IIC [Absiella sp. AM29-15]|uniref:PTS N-acetylgalactosamine transporter subunit IIC n=1 Tax=Absiella sp. AM29-15 TaxID=2292278 RepID=UPI000E3F99D3|nr:PTS N-acetylgalactosamine transporter subunit IIC [Absiella sp. AM29-15]RGC51771.1 PTS sugar transporter subunit IIC [Absiella sp. AM29-15]
MLAQILLISVFAGICGIDNYNGLFHIHRPVVTGMVVGMILGDITTGLIAGATIEFVWMAMVPLAGAQPPNVVVGGILGTAFTILTKQDPTIAVGIALPFALVGQGCIIMFFSLFSALTSKIDKTITEPDPNKFDRWMYFWLFISFLIPFILVFLPLYFGADKAQIIISMLPNWVMAGLSAIGGIMPAVGFAMLMKIMFKVRYLPFFAVGFIAAAYLHLPVIAVAVIGMAIAGYDYFIHEDKEPIMAVVTNSNDDEEDYEDGI